MALRYDQKVNEYCDGIDPFTLKKADDPLPRNVTYFDVFHYCVDRDSPYTYESFKAHKSLDAKLYYEGGWVQSVMCKRLTNGYICVATVNFCFQKFNLNPK